MSDYIQNLPCYDESEKCADGFLLYYSTYCAIEEILQEDRDPDSALETFIALCRYNFYGEEYNGTNRITRALFRTERQHIDNQRAKYSKAKQGGRAGERIPFETILQTIATGQYTTLSAVGEALGTSGQNIGKRLKGRGMDFKELLKAAAANPIVESPETKTSTIKPSPAQIPSRETLETNGCFGETNPTSTSNNTYNIKFHESFETFETCEPEVSFEQKGFNVNAETATPIWQKLV